MKTLIISLIFFPLLLIGQNKYLTSYPNFGLEIKNKTFFYTEYPDDFRIYGECNSYLDCRNEYPEQTLMSILSADNYQWDRQNFNYDIKNNAEKYKTIKQVSKKEAYFNLLLKVTFESNGFEYAIVKYHIKEKDKMILGCSILIKNDTKWLVIKPSGSLTNAFFMFNYLSVRSLGAVLNNKSIGLASFDRQIKDIHSSGILDFTKAINSTSSSNMSDQELNMILDPLFNQ